ncbi:response regulator [Candidatus Woesearchaeota archaeon]|nr:response regulator [Candidatus Woesearchaeota archaeon]
MPKTIMVVDDEEHIVKLVEVVLSMEGYKVVTAFSAKECLEKLKKAKPDLLLLDIMMPDMNGKELCQKIRADPATKDLRIAFLTILRKEEVGVQFMEDMDLKGHIIKPFVHKDLIKNIKDFLRK